MNGVTDLHMIFKIAGCCMVIFGGIAAGIKTSFVMKKRFNEITELRKILSWLRGEISYGFTPLAEAFSKLSKRTTPVFSEWLISLCNRLSVTEDGDFSKIWEEELWEFSKNTYLKKVDMENLKELGKTLGFLDVKMQLAGIDMEIEELDSKIKVMREELPGKQKTALTLAGLGGVMLAMLLI